MNIMRSNDGLMKIVYMTCIYTRMYIYVYIYIHRCIYAYHVFELNLPLISVFAGYCHGRHPPLL